MKPFISEQVLNPESICTTPARNYYNYYNYYIWLLFIHHVFPSYRAHKPDGAACDAAEGPLYRAHKPDAAACDAAEGP